MSPNSSSNTPKDHGNERGSRHMQVAIALQGPPQAAQQTRAFVPPLQQARNAACRTVHKTLLCAVDDCETAELAVQRGILEPVIHVAFRGMYRVMYTPSNWGRPAP